MAFTTLRSWSFRRRLAGRAYAVPTPVTLTAHVHWAGASTMSCCAPVVVAEATLLPLDPVSWTAATPVALLPAGTENTVRLDPDVGAGVHWKAHPMFQEPPVMVNVGLVQLPWA
jgi:hypothetical protein